MNYILEKSKKVPFYTDLSIIFKALDGKQDEYNWLLTDIEFYVFDSAYEDEFELKEKQKVSPDVLDKDVVWISGEELSSIVSSNSIQFVWAVLSGFKKDIMIDPDSLTAKPYADGNPYFWVKSPQIQHPLASIEIVCWDSSLTLLLSKDEEVSQRFKSYFPEAVDLNKYNERFIKKDM